MPGFETQDWWFILLVVLLAILPGGWLYRDARRLNRNPWPWIGAYFFAAFVPRFRFVLMALIFGGWFLTRDRQVRFWREPGWWKRLF